MKRKEGGGGKEDENGGSSTFFHPFSRIASPHKSRVEHTPTAKTAKRIVGITLGGIEVERGVWSETGGEDLCTKRGGCQA